MLRSPLFPFCKNNSVSLLVITSLPSNLKEFAISKPPVPAAPLASPLAQTSTRSVVVCGNNYPEAVFLSQKELPAEANGNHCVVGLFQ